MFRFWQHFISNGKGGLTCPGLGIHGHEIPVFRTAARRYGLAQVSGVEVWRIEPDSPAEKAGLLEDDIILSLAGSSVSNMGNLCGLVKELRGSVPVEVVLLRGDSRLERWVAPGGNR